MEGPKENPLYLACMSGDITNVHRLIHKGCRNWEAGLAGACEVGNDEMVNLMVSNIQKTGQIGNAWNAGMIHAAKGGHLQLCQKLWDLGGRDVEESLAAAGFSAKYGIVEFFIERGATNITSTFNCACKKKNLKFAKEILKRCPKNELLAFGACESGEIELFKMVRPFFSKILPAHLLAACSSGNTDLVEYLIQNGAKTDRGLYFACCKGNLKMVELMFKAGARDYEMGLQGACFAGKADLASLMASKMLQIAKPDPDGKIRVDLNYGLYGAALGSKPGMVLGMLDAGARDWNAGLLGACQSGDVRCAYLMILGNAYLDQAIVDAAVYGDHIEVLELLVYRFPNDMLTKFAKGKLDHMVPRLKQNLLIVFKRRLGSDIARYLVFDMLFPQTETPISVDQLTAL